MSRRHAFHLASSLVLTLCAGMATAAPLTIAKTFQTVSDPAGNLLPKAVPGAEVDYTIKISNPNGVFSPVTGVSFTDKIPPGTMLRVDDLGPLIPGPVEFVDGNVLGLLGSGLTFSFVSLRNAGDGVDFSSDGGTSWTYQPTATDNGCDPRITHVRVRLGGVQVAGSGFGLRFRVRVR